MILVGFSFALFACYPTQAFFLMPARAFQFALGAAAFAMFERFPIRLPSVVFYVLGATFIAAMLLLDETQPWALSALGISVVFAVTLYAAAASNAAQPLGNPIVQLIGKSSYPTGR